VGFILLGNLLTRWLIQSIDFDITPSNEILVHRVIVTSLITYAIVMAIPFVPGAEIGLAVMMVVGPDIAPLVYLCTLTALSLSFLIGRFIPERILIGLLHHLHLRKAGNLVGELEGLDARQRLDLMVQRSPRKFVPLLLKHRYMALFVAINMPGNIVIGGGGGIAMVSGMSRLFSPWLYFCTVAIAVSPFPLILMFVDSDIARWLF
jgi:hypothetical protein